MGVGVILAGAAVAALRLVLGAALTLGAVTALALLFTDGAERAYSTSDMVVSTIISNRCTAALLAMTAAVLGLGWLGSTQGARS